MKRPPGLKDIAEACGVSSMTVSKALRGDKRVALATRKKILFEADRIGYCPDPLTSRLMARLRWRREGRLEVGSVIAWLADHQSRENASEESFRLRQGAEERAEALGYRIETFIVEKDRAAFKRLSDILKTRGIEALIVSSNAFSVETPNFDLASFSSVSIGVGVNPLPVNCVAFDEFGAVKECLFRALEMGFKCPAFCYSVGSEEAACDQAMGLWVSARACFRLERTIPPFIGCELEEKSIETWIDQYQPDVIISNIPLEIKDAPLVISVNLRSYSEKGLGLVQDWATLGTAAVDQVVDQLQRNEVGSNNQRKTLLIRGGWNSGDTEVFSNKKRLVGF